MIKKILVISTNLCRGGNSNILADELIHGAKDNGNNVEKVFWKEKQYRFQKR